MALKAWGVTAESAVRRLINRNPNDKQEGTFPARDPCGNFSFQAVTRAPIELRAIKKSPQNFDHCLDDGIRSMVVTIPSTQSGSNRECDASIQIRLPS